MSEITRFSSEVKKIYDCNFEMDISASIGLDEPEAKFMLTVSENGCQIKRVYE